MTTPEAFYAAGKIEHCTVEDASLAVRRFGSGAPLLFVHGFPTHGYTWRYLLPSLALRHTCVVVDLPGLGESGWTDATDFRFTAQARRLVRLAEKLGLDRFAIVAHDTGATIARLVALATPERVAKLALVNTEIPGHRPPWIPLYQTLAGAPGAAAAFRVLLRSRRFVRSGLCLGEFFSDERRFDEPGAVAAYVDPIVASSRRADGMLRYLRGIEWDVVDRLRDDHARIAAPVLFLWGEDDRTFPVALGEKMAAQLGGPTRFERIPGASLMPHEERPDAVLRHCTPFLEAA
jgi:pimeloyl-ACP methyl ester carboxylesterase